MKFSFIKAKRDNNQHENDQQSVHLKLTFDLILFKIINRLFYILKKYNEWRKSEKNLTNIRLTKFESEPNYLTIRNYFLTSSY